MVVILHSLLVTGLSAALLAGAPVRVIAAALAVENAAAFFVLFAEGGRVERRLGNALAGIRLAVSILALVAVTMWVAPPGAFGAALFWLLFAGAVTALATPVVERDAGRTAFGARVATEADSCFLLALCVVAVATGFPRWILLAGILSYAFAVPFTLLPEPVSIKRLSIVQWAGSAASAVAVLLVLFPQAPEALRTAGARAAVILISLWYGLQAVLRAIAAARIRPARARVHWRQIWGLARSMVVYYGIPFRLFRMRRLYARLVRPGDLVMDVGAHVGNRVRALRSLGATVVAVEPQYSCVRLLHRLYGKDPSVVVEPVACGSQNGEGALRVDPEHPTLATLSSDWIHSIDQHHGDLNIRWDQTESVGVRTLDDLIAEHGAPSFIKIDVEGYEAEALRGLSFPVPAVSFEFLPASPGSALESLNEIVRLGSYRFNYSMGESMRFVSEHWFSAEEMREILSGMDPAGRSGDIYARRLTVPEEHIVPADSTPAE